jgi:hypothetical protein
MLVANPRSLQSGSPTLLLVLLHALAPDVIRVLRGRYSGTGRSHPLLHLRPPYPLPPSIRKTRDLAGSTPRWPRHSKSCSSPGPANPCSQRPEQFQRRRKVRTIRLFYHFFALKSTAKARSGPRPAAR